MKGTEWRCPNCHLLLGIAANGNNVMQLRYKTMVYYVEGKVSTSCRRCEVRSVYTTKNEKDTNEQSPNN